MTHDLSAANRTHGRDIAFGSSTDGLRGYLSRPAGDGPWPAIVVLHEVFGLNDDLRALTDRMAGMGHLCLAPDLYRGGTWWRSMGKALREVRAGSGASFDIVDAARRWLAGHDLSTGRIAVVGFSLGGGYALALAQRGGFSAAAVNYGEVPDDVGQRLRGACPIVASYGGRDRTTRGHPERLQAALSAGDVPHDVKAYPDAGHSFLSTHHYPPAVRALSRLMGMHAGPRPQAAEDAWRRTEAFLRDRLRS